MRIGEIRRVAGSIIVGTGIPDIQIGEVVLVGSEELIGEVIKITEDMFTAQVYESTSGIRPGEKIVGTNKRLIAELGPGMLNKIYDGVGRDLELLFKERGPFISRGAKISTLPRNIKWHFKPILAKGVEVEGGDIIGEVQETPMLLHKILIPPDIKGVLIYIEEGDFTVDEPVAKVMTKHGEVEIKMMQEWPVRIPRPFKENGRLPLNKPLITGQRVIDTFFPIAKGGAASIPGGFGTGKTVTLHQLAKWSDTNVVVYIGCGERGNEMSEVLTEFPELKDPRTGRPLMERTILIANTSNMPVAAREASIYMGVTMAEYYRDQGYDVALMADSTSRWAEALREISGRLEEMPVERGYPAYLPDRIAEFYERAGRVVVLGKPEREGSVTIIGAVSPPGGDFNEPVTIHTLRFTGVFWALDTELAYSRHFPAINWLKSYSLYAGSLLSSYTQSFQSFSHYKEAIDWWTRIFKEFPEYRARALELLSIAAEIESIARVIGESALPDDQRLILLTAEIIKEGFLRQSAFDEVDAYCDPQKQALLLKMIIDFYDNAVKLVKNRIPIDVIREMPQISLMMRVKEDHGGIKSILKVMEDTKEALEKIANNYGFSIKEGM
ncbi:MAG: V-type ATP synthase subunit A [Thermoprotei archaeon]|jgi:V/A-type H+-transporting ATPase subunit A